MRTPWRYLLGLVVPVRCVGCDAPDLSWCPDCAATLGLPFPVDREATAPGPPVYALARYLGAPRRAVLAYKERGRRDLALPLGRSLATALATLPEPRASPEIYLVPAPSRPAAVRVRGGPHMVAVARHAAIALAQAGRPAAVAPALCLDGRARDSVGLDAAQRAANLRGRLRHLSAGSPPPGSTVTLIDDVITTGATAAACTAVLTAAGLEVTSVLAIAATG
jgi:predicted amidophosphoribosyltransferase